jgi:hypothetical protein
MRNDEESERGGRDLNPGTSQENGAVGGINEPAHATAEACFAAGERPSKRLLAHLSSEDCGMLAVWHGDLSITEDGRVIRASTGRDGTHKHPRGYRTVWVECGGRNNHFQVLAHRLVYRHFHGSIPKGLTVNHLDGDKANNHPANLELATHKRQAAHARDVLGSGLGERNGRSKLTEAMVERIRYAHKAGGISFAKLGRQYGVTGQSARDAVIGKTWKKKPSDDE